jgi:hypothetical protein
VFARRESQNGKRLKSEKLKCRGRGTTNDTKDEEGKKICGKKMAESANGADRKVSRFWVS